MLVVLSYGWVSVLSVVSEFVGSICLNSSCRG